MTTLRIDLSRAVRIININPVDRILLTLYMHRYSLEEIVDMLDFSLSLNKKEVDRRIANTLEKLAECLGSDYFNSILRDHV